MHFCLTFDAVSYGSGLTPDKFLYFLCYGHQYKNPT